MKKIYLLLLFWSLGGFAFANSTINNSNPAVVASTFCAPQTKQIICQFGITETGPGPGTTLTTVNFTTAAGYLATDVTSFQLWENSSASFATATMIGTTLVAGLGAGAHAYAAGGFNLNSGPPPGTTYYFWITANVAGTAITGDILHVTGLTIVVGGGGTAGALTAQGAQTINNVPTAVSATATPNPVCLGSNLTLTSAATNATSYSWAGPGGYTALGQNPSAFATTATSSGIYTISATNACGTTTASSASVTVNALPSAITGNLYVCVGTTSSLSDASGAGSWTSAVGTVATVDPILGVVTGAGPGTSTIVYTETATGCQASAIVTVSTSLPTITGELSFCQYTSSSLSDAEAGGTWTASNTTIATIDPISGLASGWVAGMDTITYTYSGCTTSSVVTINPVPVPGAITGGSPICIGGTTSLADTPLGGAWVTGNPLVATVSDVGIVTGISAGTAVITYNVTNGCGTTGATFVVEVDRAPSAITLIYPQVCIGNPDYAIDSIAGGKWSVSNGNATIDSINGMFFGVALGLDTITYTLTNGCGTNVATAVVSVGQPADWGVITGPSFLCVGSSATLTETVSSGWWESVYGNATIDSEGVVTALSAGVDSIYYNVVAACGESHATLVITVDSFGTPFVNITANPGDTSCQSVPVTYTANPTFGGAAPTYIWKVNGVFVGTAASYTYVPANSDVITCDMTSSYPCANFPTATNFVIATVHPFVVPTVSVNAGIQGDTVCIGTLDSFYAVGTNTGASPVYDWSVNGTMISAGNPFVYTPNNGDVVSCKMFSSASCPIPDSAIAAITMTVNSTEFPQVTLSFNPSDSVCAGTLVTITAHGLYGGRAPSYLWIKNDSNVATGPSYTYVPTNMDVIQCEFFSSASCASPSTVLSPKYTMRTGAVVNPVVTLSSSGGSMVAYGHNDTLTASETGGGPVPTYQWIVNGVIIAGATNSTYVLDYVSTTDVVNCLVTGSGDCPAGETMETIVVGFIPSAVSQVSGGEDGLVLAPNPNNGTFSLHGNFEGVSNLDCEVTDVVGQTVYKGNIVTKNGRVDCQVTLPEGLRDGFYLMHLSTGNQSRVIRFSVNK